MKGVLISCQLFWNIQVLFHLLVDAFVDLSSNILIIKTGLNFKATINIYLMDLMEDLFAYHKF